MITVPFRSTTKNWTLERIARAINERALCSSYDYLTITRDEVAALSRLPPDIVAAAFEAFGVRSLRRVAKGNCHCESEKALCFRKRIARNPK